MKRLLSGKKALVAIALAGTAAGAFAGASSVKAINEAYSSGSFGGPAPMRSIDAGKFAAAGGSLADMVEAVGPAVVQIEVRHDRESDAAAYAEQGWPGNDFGDSYRHPQDGPPPARAALGSGFVIDPAGIVVTNNHVVGNARSVTVKLSDGREMSGRVIGRDAKTDLAVVKVEGGGPFEAIAWGDSDKVRVGEGVFAVGSPFGLGNSVTSGIVSARGREIGAGPYDDFLQVDAAINSGNSGGPLFNTAGQIIGVNTAIFSPSGGNVGIGFAIPSRMAQSVVNQILANGHVSRGRIGVVLQALTPEIARSLDIPGARGARIAEVEPGGPAAEAGLRGGDIVVEFAGQPVSDSRQLARAVAAARAGTAVAAKVYRGNRAAEVTLSIDAMNDG